jgi:hypothetical protein
MQNPTKILILAPQCFGGNEETAENNYFQKAHGNYATVRENAKNEHVEFELKLKSNGISYLRLEDDPKLNNTDAVFLNNWFCVLPDSRMVVFPMWATSRRTEIREDLIYCITSEFGITEMLDYRSFAANGQFCEGTGSIIFDHERRLAFAAISPRTSVELFERICEDIEYTPVSFEANDMRGNEIYHTNVLLSIGKNIVVVCSDAIVNPVERSMVLHYLNHSNKLLIDISLQQLERFCGNVFEVDNHHGDSLLCMSSTAYDGFSIAQRQEMETVAKILPVSIPTIEQYGGGSVRCMMAAGY